MGILDNLRMAQSKNDFAVEISDRDWTPEWKSLVSKHTKRLQVNFVKRTLIFHLRQTKIGVIQDVIFHILDSNKEYNRIDQIVITPAKGSAKNSYQYHFVDGEVIDHQCEFAYEDVGEVIHVITVEFDKVVLKSPPGAQRTEVVVKDTTDEGRQQLNG